MLDTLNEEQVVNLAVRVIALHDIAFKFPMDSIDELIDRHREPLKIILEYICYTLKITDREEVRKKLDEMISSQTVHELSKQGLAEVFFDSDEVYIDPKIMKHWRKRL